MSKPANPSQPNTANANPNVVGDDTLNPKISTSCLDFLLIELVPLAQRVTERLHHRERALREEIQRSKNFHKNLSSANSSNYVQDAQNDARLAVGNENIEEALSRVDLTSASGEKIGTEAGSSTGSVIPGTNIPSDLGLTPLMNDETRDAVFWRLDKLGYRVGQGLVERMSVDQKAGARAGEEALRRAQSYLFFPCGIVRGALAGLGIEATVTAETTEIPIAIFQIKTKGAKA